MIFYAEGCLVGCCLFLAGAFGRRVDDHPICRRCGYDLFGQSTSPRCSECGSDLATRRAIRKGHRLKRPPLIWSSCAILLLTLIGTASSLYMEVKGISSWQLKPTWLVRREANGTGSTSERAVTELQARLVKGRLNSSEARVILDDALEQQAKFTSHPNSQQWLWLFEAAAARALPTDDQWKEYVQQATACTATLRTRQMIRIGDPMPLEVRSSETMRVKSMSYLDANWRASLQLDDVELPLADSPFPETSSGLHGFWWVWHEKPEADIYKHLKPGKHLLRMRLNGSVSLGVPSMQTRYQPIPVSYSLQCPFELVPSNIETLRIVEDTKLATAVAQSLSTQLRPALTAVFRDGHSSYAGPEMELSVNAPSVGLSHDVIIITGAGERIAGTLTCARGDHTVMVDRKSVV